MRERAACWGGAPDAALGAPGRRSHGDDDVGTVDLTGVKVEKVNVREV